jgi:hypothetical protein
VALNEQQIQLYARQILLKPVGGRGQEKLCRAHAVITGSGLCVDVARTYLAAGGSSFSREPGEGGRDSGRIRGAAESQRGVEEAPATLTRRFAPPSPAEGRGGVIIGSELHWTDCADCFAEALASSHPAPDDCATLAGTLAALLFQRQVLGIGPADGRLRLHSDGTFEPIAPIRCGAHR